MKRFLQHITLILTMALVAIACTEDANSGDEIIPEGYGKLSFTIGTTDALATRAVNTTTPWLEGSGDERAIKSYVILICEGTTIVQALTSDTETALGSQDATNHYYPTTANIQSNLMSLGGHALTIYCLANFTTDMVTATGLTVSAGKVTNTSLPTNFETKVMQPIANGTSAVPSTGLPMTGKLTAIVNITSGQTTTKDTSNKDLILILWRMMAKLEFQFTNLTSAVVKVMGVEVEPINRASTSGVYLISQDDLTSTNDLVPLFPSGATKSVSATWALDAAPTQGVAASVSMGGVFASTALSWGSKVTASGSATTYDQVYTLQKFKTTENVTSKDNNAVITLKVKPNSEMSFTAKRISFKACRVGTDGGKFDVVAGGSGLATEVHPPRSNGERGDKVPPFWQEYNYAIDGTATTGEYEINIYLYDLNLKEIAFRDIIITGDMTNNTGSTLQKYITLPSAAMTDVGAVKYEPSSALELNATNGTGSLSFYVNETDATYTTTENQLSVRIKLARWNATTNAWYDDEIRFGVTTPYIDGSEGGNGFNVIRRNDWIHIPISIRDWQFRVEPIAFVPIAGYPAVLLSSDALTTTFSTGGYIILQPFAQKNNDGTWRDFSDPEVTFVSMTAAGDTQMFDTAPAYDAATQRITGIIKNDLAAGTYKTTLTVNVKLGPTGSQLDYSFTCNVVLQKE